MESELKALLTSKTPLNIEVFAEALDRDTLVYRSLSDVLDSIQAFLSWYAPAGHLNEAPLDKDEEVRLVRSFQSDPARFELTRLTLLDLERGVDISRREICCTILGLFFSGDVFRFQSIEDIIARYPVDTSKWHFAFPHPHVALARSMRHPLERGGKALMKKGLFRPISSIFSFKKQGA
jgi:hypothetical protein